MMKMALAHLTFLKRKRCWKIKERGCADGRSQREYIIKLESSLPCLKTCALFFSCLVDVFKRRYVFIVDVPGVFLSAVWLDEAPECHIRFDGTIVEMLCQIRREYQKLI